MEGGFVDEAGNPSGPITPTLEQDPALGLSRRAKFEILGAILLTGYLGGAMASHVRIGSPLFTHTLFGLYLGLMVWGGLWLRDRNLRTLIPLRR